MKKKPATIKEIAKKLKISPSTVSRALNNHPSIGLVTTMRVKKVAEELHYEPNQTAIFFKQRKKKHVFDANFAFNFIFGYFANKFKSSCFKTK